MLLTIIKKYFAECLEKTLGKASFAEYQIFGTRQRLTAVSFRMAADGPLPSATFAECFTLGKRVFAECGPVPSIQHSVKRLVAESLTLPSAALGKAFFAECPTKGTRQRGRHSAKPRISVVYGSAVERSSIGVGTEPYREAVERVSPS
jgi:hypothetical protein